MKILFSVVFCTRSVKEKELVQTTSLSSCWLNWRLGCKVYWVVLNHQTSCQNRLVSLGSAGMRMETDQPELNLSWLPADKENRPFVSVLKSTQLWLNGLLFQAWWGVGWGLQMEIQAQRNKCNLLGKKTTDNCAVRLNGISAGFKSQSWFLDAGWWDVPSRWESFVARCSRRAGRQENTCFSDRTHKPD